MAGKERDLINILRVEATKLGARLFRLNTGVGWVGKSEHFDAAKSVQVHPGDVLVRGARPLHAGLCAGASDVIGWHPVVVTPDMVGKPVALFTAFEIKTGKVPTTTEQAAFVKAVQDAGGIAEVVKTVDFALGRLRGRY